jgi:alkylated DNA repair dioxygenase AlkB
MQLPLLRPARPQLDARFHRLRTEQLGGGAWISHQSSWLDGDTEVFTALALHTRWRDERRPMYDRVVDVPRQVARLPQDGPGHPVLLEASALLSERFGRPLTSIGMNHYRDGRDSVAMHGDKVGDRKHDYTMAILSVGAPRTFRLRPAEGGPGLDFQLGWGDLLVLGGTIQATWRHGVPKSTRAIGPRISVQFRESSHTQRPENPRRGG